MLSQLSSESAYLNSSRDDDEMEDSDEIQSVKAAPTPAAPTPVALAPALPPEATRAADDEVVEAEAEAKEEEMSLTLEMSDESGREATQMVQDAFVCHDTGARSGLSTQQAKHVGSCTRFETGRGLGGGGGG